MKKRVKEKLLNPVKDLALQKAVANRLELYCIIRKKPLHPSIEFMKQTIFRAYPTCANFLLFGMVFFY